MKYRRSRIARRIQIPTCAILAAMAVAITVGGRVAVADGAAPEGRTIGYVLTEEHWGVYRTDNGKAECPKGLNDGPREQYSALFPDNGTKRTLLDTALARESEVWFPRMSKEPFPFREAGGKIAYGLNLDGKVGRNDFTSPEGEKGIDNQLYRAIGCISNYRGPDGNLYHATDEWVHRHNYNRVLVELTDVDSLVNDGAVTIDIYRGLDALLTDATGNGFIPGGTQRIDMRWGKQFIRHLHGKIVDGVLVSDPVDVVLPASAGFEDTTVQVIRGMRFRLKLSPDRAEGLMAGYTDVDAFYYQLIESQSTHLLSYGQESAPSLYRALHRLADAYPDPITRKNTAISSALEVKFVQAFIQHPPTTMASMEDGKAP